MASKDVIYLVDGSSYLYRAFHAIVDLTNSKGTPTNAIYGVTRMILKLLKERSPQYVAVIFDAKGPNFRHQLYPEYKANRPPMPDTLSVQVPIIKEIISAMGIQMLELEGYEADDIIGTLSKGFQEKGLDVVLVSGDKDLKQLISHRVSMWDPMKDKYITYEAIKGELGLEPHQLVDVMALSGDPVDNIPGVPSIGEKTALKLIQEFGSLEGVISSLEGIKPGRTKENLTRHKDLAFLSRDLVKIRQDLPISLDPPVILKMNNERLLSLFRDLEFSSLWHELKVETVHDIEAHIVRETKELIPLRDEILSKGVFSLDVETTGQDPICAELVGLSICLDPGKAYYIPISHSQGPLIPFDEFSSIFKEILEDENIKKIGHNIKYDAEVFMQKGINLKGIYFDTMVASYLVNPDHRQHNLAFLSQHYLNFNKTLYEDIVGKDKDAKSLRDVPIDVVARYCCEDSELTLRLKDNLYAELDEANNLKLFFEIEIPLIDVLIDMELCGIKIDTEIFKDLSQQFQNRINELTEEIYKEAGMEFNINSPSQLSYVLFEKLKLPTQRKTQKKKSFSTDVKVLKQLRSSPHRLPELLLEYRSLTKLKSTYLDTLVRQVNPKTGRLHTSFNQAVTATGRLSSSNPNLQNIPVKGETGREIRKAFVAQDGHVLLSADYSQIELRIFAHYSKDESFLEAFQKGEDIHSKTAMDIMGLESSGQVSSDMRRVAKSINFGIIYGMGPQKLSEELGMELKQARAYLEAYYKRYPGVLSYRKEIVERARRDGYVTTLFNRRRYLPNINSENKGLQAESERAAINTPIQGTAADLIKMAMILIHKRIKKEGLKTRMLIQVHDELLFEVPFSELEEAMAMIREEMEGVYRLRVPLKVDMGYGRNWEEAHA